MSKTTKFLSLGIDIMQAMPENEVSVKNEEFFRLRYHLNADKMEKAIKAVNSYFEEKMPGPEKEKACNGTGKVFVKVTTEGGKPCKSEVRFFPVEAGDTFTNDYEASGRIDFLRFVTDDTGVLTEKIPKGSYLLKVSKGTEYGIFYKRMTVTDNSEPVVLELEHFIDLEKEGYFAGDIHHHSIYSSPVWYGTDDVIESAHEVSDSMRAMGLKYGALSDHHNIFNHKDWKNCKTEDFLPIPSKEISTSNGHVLALGVDEYDVIYNIPLKEERTEDRLRKEFVRITDEIKENGGLAQLNHPRDLQVSISWNPDFYDMTGIFETIEIWNGSNPMYCGSTNDKAGRFWRSLLEKGQYIPITTGSDTHNIKADDYHHIYAEVLKSAELIKSLTEEERRENFPEYSKELPALEFIAKNIFPMLEVWAKTSLTSGCNRTYVKISGKPEKEKVLKALKQGHSFLTNGPFLEIRLNGTEMGDTFNAEGREKADLYVSLKSNRRLDRLILFTSGYESSEIKLPDKEEAAFYDYSMSLKDFDISRTDYIFAVAVSDVTNLAITNPVLIRH